MGRGGEGGGGSCRRDREGLVVSGCVLTFLPGACEGRARLETLNTMIDQVTEFVVLWREKLVVLLCIAVALKSRVFSRRSIFV